MNDLNSRPILIVDCMNLFVRSYCSFPAVSSIDGSQMGGIVGFCKTLGKISDLIKPIRIILAWEGGGSVKRRKIYSEYKMNRTPERLNRYYSSEDIPESDSNRQHQIVSLINLLKHVPLCQAYVADCEGDDIISYLCRGRFRDVNKMIISSDKDMYQLMDDKTQIYNLHRKTILTYQSVFDEFRIPVQNFALAKSICGDASDNIPGVPGLGYKTLIKHVPFIGLEPTVLLQDVFSYCETHKEVKTCKKILEAQDDIKRNWRLIYLDDHTLSNEQAKKIDYILDNYKPRFNKIEFIKLLSTLGVSSFDPTWFFYAMNNLENVSY